MCSTRARLWVTNFCHRMAQKGQIILKARGTIVVSDNIQYFSKQKNDKFKSLNSYPEAWTETQGLSVIVLKKKKKTTTLPLYSHKAEIIGIIFIDWFCRLLNYKLVVFTTSSVFLCENQAQL